MTTLGIFLRMPLMALSKAIGEQHGFHLSWKSTAYVVDVVGTCGCE
jgi:hypothetical protein